MKILTVDLGTNTGWCLGETGKEPTYGTLVLAAKREITEARAERWTRKEDPRIRRFWKWVRDTVLRHQPNLIVWEDVEFSSYTYQVQLWSSLRTVLQLGARAHHDGKQPMIFECVNVMTLKKFAGRATANKDDMRRLLRKKHPEIEISAVDDNAVDAIWLYKWSEFHMARLFKPYERTETESESPDKPVEFSECGEHHSPATQ